jgi:hypothetical protein
MFTFFLIYAVCHLSGRTTQINCLFVSLHFFVCWDLLVVQEFELRVLGLLFNHSTTGAVPQHTLGPFDPSLPLSPA